MMIDLYVYDTNLQLVGLVDAYTSLIWVPRYADLGDCEVYIEATTETLALLKKNYYLARNDDEMICQIKKIELDTDAENGNYLIVTGYDVKRFLDQRIIWYIMTCDGLLEDFIRDMITVSMIDEGDRAIPNFELGAAAGFTEQNSEQVSYKNLGEKVREYCKKYGWGYRVRLDSGKFIFELYKGTDRTAEVIFSDNYENLATSAYVEDDTNLGTVALVAGQGEGADRLRRVSGDASGLARHEIFVDAKDISYTLTWAELTEIYPTQDQGGSGYITGSAETGYSYALDNLFVQIIDENHLAELQADYPGGTVVEVGGTSYYQLEDAVVAALPNGDPGDSDTVTLAEIIYSVYLLTRGYDKLSEFGSIVSFEGAIEPNTTFEYKKDYFLGDLVTVENEFGISVEARITEVVEVNDNNGYSVEPKFEYIRIGGDNG